MNFPNISAHRCYLTLALNYCHLHFLRCAIFFQILCFVLFFQMSELTETKIVQNAKGFSHAQEVPVGFRV